MSELETADGTAGSPSRAAGAACRGFLKALSQSIKLVSLYRPDHPVAAAGIRDAWQHLLEVFAETGWPEAAFGNPEGRWLANDERVAEAEGAFEVLALAFKGHAVRTVVFLPGLKLYELAAFCELAATPAHKVYEEDASDFLRQRGVRSIRINVEEYARRKKAPAVPVHVVSPIPPAPPAPPPAAPAARGPGAGAGAEAGGRGFGSFIKSLVDEAVQDPAQRVQVYEEAVRLVRQALARHVHDATSRLHAERQRAVNERDRSESVLAGLAHGKVVVDKNGRVLMMDPVAEELAGAPLARVAGKPILDGLSRADRVVSLAEELQVPEDRAISKGVRVMGPEDVLGALRRSLAVVQDEMGRLVGTYAAPPHEAKFKEAERLQDEFLSKVTHDLKAPLNALCSALEVVGRGAARMAPEQARMIEIGMRNALTLRQMIGEILDFSKLHSGTLTVKPQPMEAQRLLLDSCDGLRPWAQSKGLALEAAPAPTAALKVLADPVRAVQVLNNLVSNSIKHTEPGGRVVLSAEPGAEVEPGMIVFSVADTGCGIPPEQLGRIFEKFTQLEAPGRPREGVGLGLSIVWELVALHGGRVWAESEPGKGSTFRFTLPAA